MKKLLVASNNAHKIGEIKHMLEDMELEVVSLKEAGIDVEVEETGTTFMENAYIKAKAIYDILPDKDKYIVMSDDSGLAVDALDGAPGVYSARFAGEHGNDKMNKEKLLSMLKGMSLKEKKARFICAIVLIGSNDKVLKVQGEVEGYIADREYGYDGFGYDPLFYVEEYGKTFAEITPDEKNAISHRGRALRKVKEHIGELI